MVECDDPRAIRSVAVTAEDVVMALERNCRAGDGTRALLRVTPPFSGRMRARIHLERGDLEREGGGDRPDEPRGDPSERPPGTSADGDPSPVPIPPEDLVAEVPRFPHPDDTEDAIRADPDDVYTPDRHHDRHVAAVEDWREAVRNAIVDGVVLSLDGESHRVDVTVLG